MESIFGHEIVIVGIGYPLSQSVFDILRRAADLTPPSKGGIDKPCGPDGRPGQDIEYGGAKEFQDAIKSSIIPLVEDFLSPHICLSSYRRVVFGHSFGGLFSLYSLFVEPELFDVYIAASPSIWFNNCSIVKEQEKEFLNQISPRDHSTQEIVDFQAKCKNKPQLLMTYGSLEQHAERKPTEFEEEDKQLKCISININMKENILKMATRLSSSERLADIQVEELVGEDHGSAATCGLQRGIQWLAGR